MGRHSSTFIVHILVEHTNFFARKKCMVNNNYCFVKLEKQSIMLIFNNLLKENYLTKD